LQTPNQQKSSHTGENRYITDKPLGLFRIGFANLDKVNASKNRDFSGKQPCLQMIQLR
jgi:hypothetical protein